MSKCLVLSDIHLRHKQVDTILSWEKYDKLILLGDFFDAKPDTVGQNREAAIWLKEKLEDKRTVALVGNHCSSYRWPGNQYAYASGFTWEKSRAINDVLSAADWDKLRPCHVEQGILFTHAGVDKSWVEWMREDDELMEPTATNIAAKIDYLWPHICALFQTGHYHSLLGVGFERGGWQHTGGITWNDVSCHRPIKGAKQIFGHSILEPHKGPLMKFPGGKGIPQGKYVTKPIQEKWLAGGWSLDLDTCNHHYAVLEEGRLIVKAVKWHRPKGNDHFVVEPSGEICKISL